MSLMALGATRLTRQLSDAGEIDGMIAIGGTMGTDLALDVALALPIGLPKFVVSTIRLAFDAPGAHRSGSDDDPVGRWPVWPQQHMHGRAFPGVRRGGGRGQNTIKPQKDRPVVGTASLGKSCLSYMVELKPELEKRGYEVVVFHTTGMGGRAMESMAAQGGFAAILDLSLRR